MVEKLKVFLVALWAQLWGASTPEGGGLNPPAGLTATSAAEREAAEREYVRQLGEVRSKRLEALQQAQGIVNDQYRTLVAEAAAAVQRRRDELGFALVDELHVAIAPLMAAWIDEPMRRTSEAIRALFLRLDERATHELGQELRRALIVHAYVDELVRRDPSLVEVCCRPDLWTYDGTSVLDAGTFSRDAIQSSPLFMRDLEAMEATVERALAYAKRGVRSDASQVERLRLHRRCATPADQARHLAAFDEKLEAERRAATAEEIAASQRGWEARLAKHRADMGRTESIADDSAITDRDRDGRGPVSFG